jgi:hypothetical protein
MRDEGNHRNIRLGILRQIPAELNPWHSHDEQGDIDFYMLAGIRKVHLAEPDIVIARGNEILSIEIELSNQPKHILGVAFANWMASKGAYKEQILNLDRKSLLIVVPRKANESGSRRISDKPMQFDEVKNAIRAKLDFVLLDIIAPDETEAAISDWLRGKDMPRK